MLRELSSLRYRILQEADYTKPPVREAMPVLGTVGGLGVASGAP